MKIGLFVITLFLSQFTFSGTVFKPHGCEYSVEFPSEPIYRILSTEYYGQYQVALIYSDEFFLKAECMKIIAPLSIDEQKRSVLLHAENNGIQYPSFSQTSGRLGKISSVRGFKTINNKRVTVGVALFYGKTSFLSIQVGALSTMYPTLEITKFIETVKN
jgi:hypothetical protein